MADFIGGGISIPVVSSTEPHTTAKEAPPPIEPLEPPASNAGSDDPTGGISKEAGGLSNTAGIGSPVTSEPQTVVGSVLETVFGKKERTAEEVDAAAPTSSAVTTDDTTVQDNTSSGTYLGAAGALATGAAAAGGAAIASLIPGRSTTAQTETDATPVTSSEKTLGEQAAETTESAKATAAEAIDSAKSTTADVVESAKATTSEAVESAKATTSDAVESTKATTSDVAESAKATTSDAVESAKTTASDAVESAKATTNDAAESAKNAVASDGNDAEDNAESSTKPKEVSDHEAAIRENKESIPTAGGERLGAAHEGESKVIPANPAPQDADVPGIASAEGQPDSTTAANTAKNTGDEAPPTVLDSKKDGDVAKSDKPKFFSRLKNKLTRKDKA